MRNRVCLLMEASIISWRDLYSKSSNYESLLLHLTFNHPDYLGSYLQSYFFIESGFYTKRVQKEASGMLDEKK